MPASATLTGKNIRKAARAALAVLEDHGLQACLFGSAACAIYGMENREPNAKKDVDIIVLAEMDPEDIKDLIVSNDDRFYLIPSTNPLNTYEVLWFRLNSHRSCKVDILVPGLLSIPMIPAENISYIEPFEDIPVAPFLTLLLLKLRGWTDHIADHRRWMRDKAEVDREDIDELLELGVREYNVHLDEEEWMPKWFIQEAAERISQYAEEWPQSSEHWQNLGFEL